MPKRWSVDLNQLPGGDALSASFCNMPVSVDQSWLDEPVAVVLLCGRDAGHGGACGKREPLDGSRDA